MPNVSVIIPNYNHAPYLNQRIDSVLNQTYQDFELIILDDKSTDNSKEVIESYRSHPKVSQIVYNEINSGSTFKQWNRGIRLAKGELIWLAESDDDASEFFLEEMVSRFNQNSNLGIVYCDSYYINEKNKKLKRTHLWKNERFSSTRWNNDFINTGINEVNNYLIYHNVIDNASSALFKKEVLFKAGLADESFRYIGDLFLYMKVLMLSDVAYVTRPLNYFREHAQNTTKESFTNGFKPLESLLSYSKIILNNNNINKETKRKCIAIAVQNYSYFNYLTLNRNKDFSSFIRGNLKLIKANLAFSLKLYTCVLMDKLSKLAN